MKNTRRGLGKGKRGYYNILPMDSHIHSLSAKGVSTYAKRVVGEGHYQTPMGSVETWEKVDDDKFESECSDCGYSGGGFKEVSGMGIWDSYSYSRCPRCYNYKNTATAIKFIIKNQDKSDEELAREFIKIVNNEDAWDKLTDDEKKSALKFVRETKKDKAKFSLDAKGTNKKEEMINAITQALADESWDEDYINSREKELKKMSLEELKEVYKIHFPELKLTAKGKKEFEVEIYNSTQSVYPDVFETKKFKTKREAMEYAKSIDSPIEAVRVRKNGKIIYDDGEDLSYGEEQEPLGSSVYAKNLSKEIVSHLKHSKLPDSKFNKAELMKGMKVEMEHTTSKKVAKAITKAHLVENKDYYKKFNPKKKTKDYLMNAMLNKKDYTNDVLNRIGNRRLHFQSKENRDKAYKILVANGYHPKKSTSKSQQIHPEYIEDYAGEIETGFGNSMYRTYFKNLYNLEV